MKTAWIGGAAALIALGVPGCALGTRPAYYSSVRTGQGIRCIVLIAQTRQRVRGELLAAGDTSVIMVVDAKVWLVPYRMIVQSDCGDGGSIPFDDHARLVVSAAKVLQKYSRYPQGIDPDLWQRLLQAYGQTAPNLPDPSVRHQ
ncbi:MAG TPA: hypothetical protein VGI92_08105 [Gemmatimonadales bacterium]|jgi:hypothetical protein